MKPNAKTSALLALALGLAACARSGLDTQALLDPDSGGAATVRNATHRAFAQPAANLDVQQRGRFFIGNAFFNSPWVVAPATAGARDGLGPLFNARSCDACHNNDGRGRPPQRLDERPVSLVIQFATPVPGDNNEPGADPRYGGNLNPFAIGGVPAEGTVRIRHRDIHGTFSDGEHYTLLAPVYEFAELAYGELAHDNQFSPRVAPPVIGMGLLEAIPESQILERADPDDKNGDGISGRPNHVWNHLLERAVIGRLGWKSNQPDIAHQTAGAFSSEIGMTTSLRPDENCTNVQTACRAAPTGGSPEISDEIFTHIVDYQQMLGVPARRNLDTPEVKTGARLFLDAGCESCHRATSTTAESSDKPWLSKQTIHPFTDLLLHDMGPGLADGRADFEASGSEWRTAPLWGIGLQEIVNGHTLLLHDGRARNVSEAILWHDGEAAKSQQAFLKMSKADREALLAFINSL
ncbi:di-heme oxidoredictase family protein [Povalibacter sp.]|uniref:di-heme oxidoreductase family protein n=1 Tax=Povalibacter sp. TaxID=1962978 RepID=UPI002F422930